MRVLSAVALVALAGCAAAPVSEPAQSSDIPTVEPPDAPAPEPGVTVPNQTLGAQGPGATFDKMPSWPKTPNECASARFEKDGDFVTDSTTGLAWAAGLVIDRDAAYNAGADCNARYNDTRVPTTAEVQALTTAVAGCPLPGAFWSVDLWPVTTSDGTGCVDLKTGQSLATTCAVCWLDTSVTPNVTRCNAFRETLCVHN